MLNRIKSDLLKLRYSYLNVYFFIGIIGLFIFYLAVGEHIWANNQITQMGFLVRGATASYGVSQVVNLTITSVAYTFFYWGIVLLLVSLFYAKEYKTGMIKRAIMKGTHRLSIYISKILCIGFVSTTGYYILCIAILVHSAGVMNYPLSIQLFLTALLPITLNALVLLVFILGSFLVCLVIKNVISTFIIVFMATFISFILSLSFTYLDQVNPIFRGIIKVSPMYYWLNISGGNFNENVMTQTLVYFCISTIVLIGVSGIILSKQEIK